MNDDTRDQPIPDELKIDVDQEALAKWDDVSADYAGEGEEEKKRPAFTGEKSASGSPETSDDAEKRSDEKPAADASAEDAGARD